MLKTVRKTIALATVMAFLTTTLMPVGVYAQAMSALNMPWMPMPGVRVSLSPQFDPSHLVGITVHPDNALQFDFLIQKGDKEFSDDQKKNEYQRLIKYFLASLTVPDDEQWVNLSPYEKDRIISNDFGKTEMGRDLLSQDYILKQISASLMYPEENLGKKFWEKIYQRAHQEYGTTNVPVDTFNKVWIVPDEALVYESGNTAYILKSHLKVMMQEDYLSLSKHTAISNSSNKTHTLASQIIKEIILPELEKEVNEGKNFAPLRQVYSGMILATWYKKALRESLLGKVYADKGKVKGVDQDPKANEIIYQRYLKAFKKGVFNYIKEDKDIYTQETVPRKYFSGGFGRTGNEVRILNDGNLSQISLQDRQDINAAMITIDSTQLEIARTDLYNHGTTEVLQERRVINWMKRQIRNKPELKTVTGNNPSKVEHDNGYFRRDAFDVDARNQILAIFRNNRPSYLDAGVLEEVISTRMKVKLNANGRKPQKVQGPLGVEMSLTFDADISLDAAMTNKPDDNSNPDLEQNVRHFILESTLVLEQSRLERAERELNRQRLLLEAYLASTSNGKTPPENKAMAATDLKTKDENFQRDLRATTDVVTSMLGFSKAYGNEDHRNILVRYVMSLSNMRTRIDHPSDGDREFLNNIRNELPSIAAELLNEMPVSFSKDSPSARLKAAFQDYRTKTGESRTVIGNLLHNGTRLIFNVLGFAGTLSILVVLWGNGSAPSVQTASTENSNNLGGIDLNGANLNLQIKRDGRGVPLPLVEQDMSQLGRIEGFVPVIIEIKPVTNLPLLSELQQKLQSAV